MGVCCCCCRKKIEPEDVGALETELKETEDVRSETEDARSETEDARSETEDVRSETEDARSTFPEISTTRILPYKAKEKDQMTVIREEGEAVLYGVRKGKIQDEDRARDITTGRGPGMKQDSTVGDSPAMHDFSLRDAVSARVHPIDAVQGDQGYPIREPVIKRGYPSTEPVSLDGPLEGSEDIDRPLSPVTVDGGPMVPHGRDEQGRLTFTAFFMLAFQRFRLRVRFFIHVDK